MFFRIICLAIGYCVGLIQAAFIVGKIIGKIDIREHGSGNSGTTNAVRVLGVKAGLIVFLTDMFKAVIGFLICMLVFKEDMPLSGMYGGLGAILGHNFPFYLKFRGGKGTASFLGLVLCMSFIEFRFILIIYIVGFWIAFLSKYISLASLVITLLFPACLYYLKFSLEAVLIGAVIAALSWVMHRQNIIRLIKGTESKFNFKKQI